MIWKTLLYLIDKKSIQIEELFIKDIKNILRFIREIVRGDVVQKTRSWCQQKRGSCFTIDTCLSEESKDTSFNTSIDTVDGEKRFLTEEQFYMLLDKIQLNDDRNFSKKLFSIFWFHGGGKVDYNEFFHRIFQFWMIKKWDELHNERRDKKTSFLSKRSGTGISKKLEIFLNADKRGLK